MEKTGLIIINGYKLIDSIKYMVDRFTNEFSKQNVQIEVKSTAEILTFIQDNQIKTRLPKYDFVLFLDKDQYISHMLEECGYKLFNNASAIEICDDKMKTYLALANKGIKMPKTIAGTLNYSNDMNLEFIKNVSKELSFPIVIKENYGSQGKKVYLANNFDELIDIESKITNNPRLFQEYIPSSKGIDYRLIIIGGKYIAGMKRRSLNDDFRSNINVGGTGEVIDMPISYVEMAEKAASLLNLDYCGVDILEGPNKEPILCEVNSNAFFVKLEEVTKSNVAKAYVAHILNNI